MNFDCFGSKIHFTFQFMASESSLLQKWHPAYQPSASGIPLKMARCTKKGGGGAPSYLGMTYDILVMYHEPCTCGPTPKQGYQT